MKIRILESGGRDLQDGYQFYESQDAGLGDYFLSSIKADIEGLRITAGVHSIFYKDYHRSLCKTFPFALYYTKSSDVITIYAVVDCRRDPLWRLEAVHLEHWLGFVRVSVVTGLQPDIEAAKQALDALKSSSRVRFELISDDIGATQLPAFVKKNQSVTDSHLVELARKHSMRLVTLEVPK